jgi:hypothetical protein
VGDPLPPGGIASPHVHGEAWANDQQWQGIEVHLMDAPIYQQVARNAEMGARQKRCCSGRFSYTNGVVASDIERQNQSLVQPGCCLSTLHSPQRKRPRCIRNVAFINAGNDLLSHTLSRAVQSALRGLTSVFGMGTGGSPAVRSPTTCSSHWSLADGRWPKTLAANFQRS